MLIISLLSIITINVFATNSLPRNVKLIGNDIELAFVPSDDFFLSKDNMLPGDIVSGEIIIENTNSDSFDLYIRAQKLSQDEQFDLITKLELIVSIQDKVIYQGSLNTKETLKEDVYITTVYKDNPQTIKAKISLDGEATGNEYKNKSGEVEWIFTAVRSLNDNSNNEVPNTGDSSIKLYVIVASISLIMLLLVNINKNIK